MYMHTFDDVQIIPKYSEIKSREMCDTTSWFTQQKTVKVPVISSPMSSVTGPEMLEELHNLGASGILHRFDSIETQWKHVMHLYNKGVMFGVSIGVQPDDYRNVRSLVDHGANIVLIDVAHGHHKNVKDMIEYLHEIRKVTQYFDIIAGNVATAEGALDLQKWGADAIRVGVGGGAMCTTRITTGVGVPQLHAIQEIARAVKVPIIADGGIRTPGDVAKAIAAGADTVMLGSMLAGTKETPGDLVRLPQKDMNGEQATYKMFYGSASATQKQLSGKNSQSHVEGASTYVKYKGEVKHVIQSITDGLKSAMSYVGASTIAEFQAKAEFCHITPAGQREAQPHGL